MGFDLNLLVVVPEKQTVSDEATRPLFPSKEPEDQIPSKEYVMWRISGIVNIGRTTRLEKIVAPHFKHIHDQFPGKQRAAICIVDHLFIHLTDLLKTPSKEIFAPQFTADPENGLDSLDWRTKRLKFNQIQNDDQFVEPLEALKSSCIPTTQIIKQHNRALKLADADFATFVESSDYRIIDCGPCMWNSAENIVLQLNEMERIKSEGWQALIKDDVAVAYFRSWCAYLKEMSVLGARTIFLFDHLQVVDMI